MDYMESNKQPPETASAASINQKRGVNVKICCLDEKQQFVFSFVLKMFAKMLNCARTWLSSNIRLCSSDNITVWSGYKYSS